MPALSSPWAAHTLLADLDSMSCHEIRKRMYLEEIHRGYMKPHLCEEVFFKPQTQGKAREDLEGDLLALLHEALHM